MQASNLVRLMPETDARSGLASYLTELELASSRCARIVAAQPRDVSVRRFMERDGNNQGDDPGRGRIERGGNLLKHGCLGTRRPHSVSIPPG
jgi:hypothetical protein